MVLLFFGFNVRLCFFGYLVDRKVFVVFIILFIFVFFDINKVNVIIGYRVDVIILLLVKLWLRDVLYKRN